MLQSYPHDDFHVLNVDWLIKKYKELSAKYEELLERFGNLEDEFEEVKTEFEAIRKEFDALLETISQEIERITSEKIDAALEVYQAELEALRQSVLKVNERLTVIENLLNEYQHASRTYTDEAVENVRKLLEAQIVAIKTDIDDLQWTLPKVYNLTTGTWTDLTTLVYDVYDATRDMAYTALEFDAANWTCDKLDGYGATAYYWDTEGREYLYPSGTCISPITGKREKICDILEEMERQITQNNSLTASEYDALMLTASEYDALNLTSYTYDYFGRLFVRKETA